MKPVVSTLVGLALAGSGIGAGALLAQWMQKPKPLPKYTASEVFLDLWDGPVK